MTIGTIVFARMGSERLPGKALLPVGDVTVIEHVLCRCRRVEGTDGVVLATSVQPLDDPLAVLCQELGVPVFRGSLEDVARRGYECAVEHGWDAFVRICGDRIFFPPEDVTPAVAVMREGGFDLVSNGRSGSVPVGLTVEVVRTSALGRVLEMSRDARDREHLTRYFYGHEDHFRIAFVVAPPPEAQGCRLAVDTAEDLERACYIASHVTSPCHATLPEVLAAAEAWENGRGVARHA